MSGSAMFQVAANGTAADMKKLLQESGRAVLEWDYDSQDGISLLNTAIRENNVDVVRLLLEEKANPNNPTLPYLPLRMAAGYVYTNSTMECVKALVQAGADIHQVPCLLSRLVSAPQKHPCLDIALVETLIQDHGASFETQTEGLQGVRNSFSLNPSGRLTTLLLQNSVIGEECSDTDIAFLMTDDNITTSCLEALIPHCYQSAAELALVKAIRVQRRDITLTLFQRTEAGRSFSPLFNDRKPYVWNILLKCNEDGDDTDAEILRIMRNYMPRNVLRAPPSQTNPSFT